VIAVGQKRSSRCHLVSGNGRSGYYATLSHCWGDPHNRPLSTTDQTLPSRQRGIEDEALPKTFRHAVHVCRELGIEYIWIDSLCIIQEQETQEDWAKEAPRMGLVYGNSTLNISAAAAADSTQGCFRERLGLITWPCPIMLFEKACCLSRYPVWREEHMGDPGDAEHSGDIDQDFSNVLARRAWVLQEQVLSRRSIIFAEKRLIWRCPTLLTNEKYPLGIPRAPDISSDNRRLLHCILNGITSFIPEEPAVDIYTCWYRTVVEFTSRNLTYEQDRLPAISGIAKRFGTAVNDNYHAGLWRKDMVFGLLWYVIREEVECTSNLARAPSWSWASVNGEVYYFLVSLDGYTNRTSLYPLVDILDVSDPTTCKDHPFGVTSSASLSLSGVLLAELQDEHVNSGLVLIRNGIRFADFGILTSHFWDPDGPEEAPLTYLPVCVYYGYTPEGTEGNGGLNKISWERSMETEAGEFKSRGMLPCLVLQAIEGSQDTYRRVGLCDVRGRGIIEISRMALFGERRSITLI